ncbi:MAG: DUF4230 domain-containing protein [Bacteroidota bacterium]
MKQTVTYLLLALVVALNSCGTDDTPVSHKEIFEIRTIGTLSTSEYTVSKIIKLNDVGEWYKWGDRKILISCKAKIKAGVNLNKLKADDIKVTGKKIEIQLPPAEIISFEMNPDQIKTEMVDVSGFRGGFSQQEKNRILRLGEKSIRKDMKQLNILNDAETNAIVFLTDFYKNLGFEEIIIHGTKQDKRTKNTDR